MRAEGIDLKIISQQQEGSIGFLTATQACPTTAATDLVAWDSGGGSFQITSVEQGEIRSWMRSIGYYRF